MHAFAQETVLWGLQRAACYTGGCVVPEHALDDSAFAPSSRSPSGPSTATLASEPQLPPGRYLFQTQDPWCAGCMPHAAHCFQQLVSTAAHMQWRCCLS